MDDQEFKEKKAIILDNGSGYIKCGFGGEEGPRCVLPTIIGYPKYKGINTEEEYIGGIVEKKRQILNIIHPIKRVMVKDWNLIEKIWDYIFKNQLKNKEQVYPNDYDIIITQPLKNLKENKSKVSQIMFETFNVKGLCLAYSPLLSLYAGGKFEGMVAELGHGTSQFCPIIDGHPILDNCSRINIGGKDITKYIWKLINKNQKENIPKYLVRDIKEKSCYIALDYEEELKSVQNFDYKLPDGNHIIMDEKRIKCPEALIFNPKLKWREEKGIAETCFDLIQKCDFNLRKTLYNAIILSGGNSMFEGLPQRFTKDLKRLTPDNMKEEVNVIANPERKDGAWIGGSILSTLPNLKDFIVKREDYEENGFSIIEKKFN